MPYLPRLTPLAISLALLLGTCVSQAAETPASSAPASSARGELPLEELRTFAEVLDRIKSAYVEPVDDKTLLENAIKGMLSNLDPHSSYLGPEDFRDLQENTSGEFSGIGIEVGMEDGMFRVVAPIDDTPAAKAGIQSGDLILKIDGKPTSNLSMMEVVDLLRGKVGTTVELTLVRDEDEPFDLELTRASIPVKSVKSQLLESGYGYLRVSQFQVNTGDEVGSALASLKKENAGKRLDGLILDLRNNPGGVVQAAVEVSDHFMRKGLIVYTKGRIANSEMRFSADPRDASENVPLVILINGGSASASEIVAGALQDHKRGIVMGTESFGKGSVQTVLPLTNERALKLTTALYFTPNGRSIQAQGITPDIEVKPARLTHEKDRETYKEADLAGHLGNGNGGADKPSGKSAKPLARPQDDDYQLNQALSLLKGLNVARGGK